MGGSGVPAETHLIENCRPLDEPSSYLRGGGKVRSDSRKIKTHKRRETSCSSQCS